MEFLNSLKKRSKHNSTPFSHWELNEPLTQETIKEICKAEIIDLTKILGDHILLQLLHKNLKDLFLLVRLYNHAYLLI